MGWMDTLKVKAAENIQDYWMYLAGITIGQEDEPTESQISKALKFGQCLRFYQRASRPYQWSNGCKKGRGSDCGYRGNVGFKAYPTTHRCPRLNQNWQRYNLRS